MPLTKARQARDEESALESLELHNARGDSIRIMPLGGIIHEWQVKTRNHGLINVILGYPHARSYYKDTAFHGAVAGRYCNRIANSHFTLNNKGHQLYSNEGEHHLHGGPDGFSRRIWNIEEYQDNRLVLSLLSPDGDQGYPGNLQVMLSYTLDDDGTLDLDWHATTDADTVVSLTSHGYYNLAGSGDILDHYLRIPAARYTPVDSELIPSGEVRDVSDTCLDLRTFTRLRDLLESEAPEILACDGLDHNWAWGESADLQLRAELLCRETGLLLSTSSTLPGLQCYSGNHLQANGIHGAHEGICLEPQYYPDSPNHLHFPSPVLKAGETMRHRIRYQVSLVDAPGILARN